jgi:AmiR/NasT family two-component response regulator
MDDVRVIEAALLAADEALDRAWESRAGLATALDDVRRLSARLGRNPRIEDAKIQLARLNGCSPSDAFDHLRRIWQSTNRPIREVADEILAGSVLAESPASWGR